MFLRGLLCLSFFNSCQTSPPWNGALGAVTGELVGSLYRSYTQDEVEQAQTAMDDLVKSEADSIGDTIKAGYSESEVHAYLEYKLKSGGYQAEIDQLRQNGGDLARFSAGLVSRGQSGSLDR